MHTVCVCPGETEGNAISSPGKINNHSAIAEGKKKKKRTVLNNVWLLTDE